MSRRARQTTRTEEYFLRKYGRASVGAAVERAAQAEREALLGSFDFFASLPVDVERIAVEKGIRLVGDIAGAGCEEGRLVATREGFVVAVRKASSATRRRRALAHEIGHTLFYEQREGRIQHAVGVLDGAELAAEERICEAFAAALLMPGAVCQHGLFLPPDRDLLRSLDDAARRFGVSIPALVVRLGQMSVPRPGSGTLVVYSRWARNRKTGRDDALRVGASAWLGAGPRCRIWSNRTVAHVGIPSAADLFGAWQRLTAEEREAGGRYAWMPSTGLVRLGHGVSAGALEESVEVSCQAGARWWTGKVRTQARSELYARPRAADREGQVLSVLTPVGGEWDW